MLVQFTVGNYRSIKYPVTLSMIATPLKAVDPIIDKNNTIEVQGGQTLLGSAVIYGANASGKSNLIHALAVMKKLVVDSARAGQIGDRLPVEPFLLSEQTRNEPTFFEIVFRAPDGEGGERQYRYGFEATATEVVAEWLYQKKERERRVFEIAKGEKPAFSDWFPEWRKLLPLVRSNSLFLSVAAQFNQPVAGRVVEWFGLQNSLLSAGTADEPRSLDHSLWFLGERDGIGRVLSFLKSLDTGIEGLRLAHRSGLDPRHSALLQSGHGLTPTEALTVITQHTVLDATGSVAGIQELDIHEHESRGTLRMFQLSGLILSALDNNQILIIDEIEEQLHPRITSAIIKMFGENRPPSSRAQLLAATHDSNLLDDRLLRRDQVWFVEKDRSGASDLFSLAEIKVRNDVNFESRYLGGAFGAVPSVDVIELILSARGGSE